RIAGIRCRDHVAALAERARNQRGHAARDRPGAQDRHAVIERDDAGGRGPGDRRREGHRLTGRRRADRRAERCRARADTDGRTGFDGADVAGRALRTCDAALVREDTGAIATAGGRNLVDDGTANRREPRGRWATVVRERAQRQGRTEDIVRRERDRARGDLVVVEGGVRPASRIEIRVRADTLRDYRVLQLDDAVKRAEVAP